MAPVKARWWCITVNTVGDEERPKDPYVELSANGLLYFCFQLERAPHTGRLHFQGVLRFASPKTLEQVKSFIAVPSCHLEVCRDPIASVKYCKKEDSRVDGPWEGGDSGHQGRRSDLQSVAEIVRSGGGLAEVARQNPCAVMKFAKGILALDSVLNPPPHRPDVKVFLMTGPTGTGKTSLCWTLFPDLYQVFCMKHPWFDGYAGQNVMLFDEMGPNMLDINLLKKVLDVYPVHLEVKGGSTPMKARIVLVTSNYQMDQWYPRASPEDYLALSRRFTKQFHIDSFSAAATAMAEIRLACGLLPVPVSPRVGAVAPPSSSSSDYGGPAIASILSVMDSDSEDPPTRPPSPVPVRGPQPAPLPVSSDDDYDIASGYSGATHDTPMSCF